MKRSQIFDFLVLKTFVTWSVLRGSNSPRYHWICNLLVTIYKLDILESKCVLLFHYFNFERSSDVLKSKRPFILLDKNRNFNKNETESKMENPTHSFRETRPSSYKNRKLKVKLWWVGACKRRKRAFFVPFSFSKEMFFFNIRVYLNV